MKSILAHLKLNYGLLAVPAACLAAAAIGFFTPSEWADEIITYGAVPVSLLFVVCFGYLLIRRFRASVSLEGIRADKGIIILSLLMIVLYENNDQRANKILLDELAIQSSALQLLENNQYLIPSFTHNIDNEQTLLIGFPPKRPPLFPFLLSIFHKILGYSQFNGFILNAIIGFLLFICLGKVGNSYLPRWGGPILIVSVGSLPLLSQNVTSQHYEILYLALIVFLILTSVRILRDGKTGELSIAYLAATGIALTRYEGLIFFIVPWIIHLYLTLDKRRERSLMPVYLVSPVVIIFIFCLVSYIFSHPEHWQLEDLNNTNAFSIAYWGRNLGAFLDFMLTTNQRFPVSLPLAVLGLSSLPISLLVVAREFRKLKDQQGRVDPLAVVLVTGIVSMAIFLGLIFSYHWGYVNADETSRFLLFPFFVLALSFLYSYSKEPVFLLVLALLLTIASGLQTVLVDESHPGVAFIITVIGIVTLLGFSILPKYRKSLSVAMLSFWCVFLTIETLSAIADREYENDYYPIERTKTFLKWIDEYADQNILFISSTGLYGSVAGESAIALTIFEIKEKELFNLRQSNRFSDIFILQETSLDDNGVFIPRDDWKLPEKYVTETLAQRRINGFTGVQLLRLISIGEELSGEVSESPQPSSVQQDGESIAEESSPQPVEN